MSSDQSSFREMYNYPALYNKNSHPKRRSPNLKKHPPDQPSHQVESFDKFVRKTKNVVLFAQKLKQRIAKKRTLNMQNLSQNQMDYLQNQSLQIQEKTWFSNENWIILALEIVFLAVLLVFVWKSSFQIVLSKIAPSHYINSITLVMYFLHAFLFLYTEYKNQKQELVNDRKQIQQIYIHHTMLKDVIVVAMIILQEIAIDDFVESNALEIIIRLIPGIFAYIKMRQVVIKVEDRLSFSTHTQTTIAMLKLLFKIFQFLHCLSIILNLLGSVESYMGVQHTWLTNNTDFKGCSDIEKYVLGWYWGATILSTVGFGDIVPANNIQRFFVSLVQVFCCMAFGYFVNVIGGLLRMKAERDEKYDKQIRSLNRFLSYLTLTQDLKLKIKNHFFNRHQIQKKYDSGQEKSLVQHLSLPLKTTLMEQNNLSVLKKCSHFQKIRSEILIKLSHNLKRVIFAPEHIIYSRETEEKKLWLIESGTVEEFTDNYLNCHLRKKIAHFQESGQAVGWINFLTQKKYNTTAKASKFTVSYELEESKFNSVLQENSKDWYKILGLKQTMIENRRQYIQKCLSCDRYTHNAIDCPRIHLIRKDPMLLMKRFRCLQFSLLVQTKKMNYKRVMLHMNWKINFAQSGCYKTGTMKADIQQTKYLDLTIEHFIKNMSRLQSSKNISNKKISGFSNKIERDSKVELQLQDQNIRKSTNEKSVGSINIDEQEDILNFEKILNNGQNHEYMPQHNIEEVLTGYNRFKTKKHFDNSSREHLFQII